MPRLRHVDCSEPGFGRRRRGLGFAYVDERGNRLADPVEIERIKALAIPPAWTDVWICRRANGHLQAVGTDAAGRRQYLYHPVWREQRDRQKFDEMLAFARVLPRLRRESAGFLAGDGLSRERVLGLAVVLLDRGLFRIGSEEYADENGGYGLATLERRHVRLDGDRTLVFDYVGKTGQHLVQRVVGSDVYTVGADLKRRRGRLKSFLVFENGTRYVDVRAGDVNEFIKELTRGDFSAKDFRTWHATVLAASALARSEESATAAGRKRAINAAAETVAEALGNTPAVSKSSYIDPRVFDRFRAGNTIPAVAARLPAAGRPESPQRRSRRERAVLRLLSGM
jgi:DNA topoisomerase-1